jgi:hypothetical protein
VWWTKNKISLIYSIMLDRKIIPRPFFEEQVMGWIGRPVTKVLSIETGFQLRKGIFLMQQNGFSSFLAEEIR